MMLFEITSIILVFIFHGKDRGYGRLIIKSFISSLTLR